VERWSHWNFSRHSRIGRLRIRCNGFWGQRNCSDGDYEGYEPLVKAIAKFFKTGHAPVSAEETIEMFTFMQAADDSKNASGLSVPLADTRQRAEATLKTSRLRDSTSHD